MFNMFNEKNTFCINLDRRPDRWAKMQSIFTKTNLSVTRWTASLPKDVTDRITGSPTQQACAQSHIRIWKHMLKNDIPYALILEDDVTFDKEWRQKLEKIGSDTEIALLMLNTNHQYGDIENWVPTRGESWLTGAYVLTKKTAHALLDAGMRNGFLPSDWMLIQYQKASENRGCYSYFPYLAIQTSLDSDIAGSLPETSYREVVEQLSSISYDLSNYITP